MTDKLPSKHLNKPYSILIDNFKEYLLYERQLAHTTTMGYLCFVSDFAAFIGCNLDEVSRDDIRDFIKHKKGHNMLDSSISNYVISLRSFYNWLADRNSDRRLTELSFYLQKIVRIKREYTITQVPSTKEIDRLRQSIHAHKEAAAFNKTHKKYGLLLRDAAILEMLIAIGSRSEEIRSITLNDVDFENKTVLILRGKGNRQRVSIFGDLACNTIKEHVDYHKFEPEDKLFRMGGCLLNNLIKKWACRSGINERIHSHSFRHYHVTETQRLGVPMQLVADQVGHRSLNTTRHYTHLDVEHRREHYQISKL